MSVASIHVQRSSERTMGRFCAHSLHRALCLCAHGLPFTSAPCWGFLPLGQSSPTVLMRRMCLLFMNLLYKLTLQAVTSALTHTCITCCQLCSNAHARVDTCFQRFSSISPPPSPPTHTPAASSAPSSLVQSACSQRKTGAACQSGRTRTAWPFPRSCRGTTGMRA